MTLFKNFYKNTRKTLAFFLFIKYNDKAVVEKRALLWLSR